jgi:hypothetical protein
MAGPQQRLFNVNWYSIEVSIANPINDYTVEQRSYLNTFPMTSRWEILFLIFCANREKGNYLKAVQAE